MKLVISRIQGCAYWMENGSLYYAPLPLGDTAMVDTENDGGMVDFDFLEAEGEQKLIGELLEIKKQLNG